MIEEEKLRKLDMLVAEKVMGYVWMRYAGPVSTTSDGIIEAHLCEPKDWETYPKGKDGQSGRYMLDDGKYPRQEWPNWARVPRFTIEVDTVTAIMGKLGPPSTLSYIEDQGKMVWVASFKNGPLVRAETASLAVCVASLRAVGCKVEDP